MRFWALIKNVVKELLHDKIYFVAFLGAIVLVLFSLLLGQMTFAEANKVIADFGFLAVFLIIQFITVFSGAWGLQREMDKQTLLLMLARPIHRESFLFARFVGVAFYNLTLTLLLSLVLFFILKGADVSWLRVIAVGIVLWAQSFAILGFSMLGAQLVRPSLAAGLSTVVLLLGFWLGDLRFFAEKSGEATFLLAVEALHWLIPQFYKMNVKSWFAVSEGIPSDVGVWALVHCGVWGFITALLASFVFRRKDLV